MTQQYPDWWGGVGQYQNPWGGIGRYQYPNSGRPGDPPWGQQGAPYYPTAPGGVGQFQNPPGGVGMYQYPNSGRPGDNPNFSTLNPQAPINPFMPQFGNPFGGLSQFGQMTPQQLGQSLGWSSPLNTPTPTLRPPFQSQAPFSDYPGWNMQTQPPSVGRGQPGAAWNPGSAQGRPAAWNVQQGMGPFGPGGGTAPAPWRFSQYDPNNPGAVPQDYWNDPSFLTYTDYADSVAARQRDEAQRAQQGQQWGQNFGEGQRQFNVGAGQWQQDFNAQQGQQGIQNGQWDRTFAQQGSQWDRNFNAQQGQQGWQNNFTQTEADRAADQWGQTFGANQAQNAWNNQYQTGRATAADSQWGQTFGANEAQRGTDNARNAALDQWNQAFSQAGFDWRKQQDTEQNRLADQGQNLAAFGRRFGPNVSYM